MILHTEFGLIWTTPWPDEKKNFLKFPKIRNSRNSQISVWKPKFFTGKLYKKFFLLYTLTTLLILHTVFGLIWANSLTRWKRPIFKTPFSRSSKSSVWNTNFFPRQALPKIFLLYTLITLVILHTEFGLILTIAWPDEKEIFLKFSKICNSRNSQNSVWKPIFFLGKLYQ